MSLAQASGYFDEIVIDDRPPIYNFISVVSTMRQLRKREYSHVYDLQCSSRTSWYYRMLKGRVKNWYGRASGCSHYVPITSASHSLERLHDIIKASGLSESVLPDVSWLKDKDMRAKIKSFERFVLLIPGSAAKHARKRWTANGYAELIDWLSARGIKSVVTGAGADEEIVSAIIERCKSNPINLVHQAPFGAMTELARAALAVAGSDTGPMHIAAATSSTCLVLFSSASDPNKSKPCGDNVKVIAEENLENLPARKVIYELSKLLTLKKHVC